MVSAGTMEMRAFIMAVTMTVTIVVMTMLAMGVIAMPVIFVSPMPWSGRGGNMAMTRGMPVTGRSVSLTAMTVAVISVTMTSVTVIAMAVTARGRSRDFMIDVVVGQFILHVALSINMDAGGDQSDHAKHGDRQRVDVVADRDFQVAEFAQDPVSSGVGGSRRIASMSVGTLVARMAPCVIARMSCFFLGMRSRGKGNRGQPVARNRDMGSRMSFIMLATERITPEPYSGAKEGDHEAKADRQSREVPCAASMPAHQRTCKEDRPEGDQGKQNGYPQPCH